jgi:hypothetical protein
LFPLPPPGSFFGVPSFISNVEYYWRIKEKEEKIWQIKDNLPDFFGYKDHLFEMENCWCQAPRAASFTFKFRKTIKFRKNF